MAQSGSTGRLLAGLCAAWLLLLAQTWLPAVQEAPVRWRTGRALTEALAETSRWSAVGVTLAEQLQQWQVQAEVPVIRDRRLDPDRRLTVETELTSRGRILQQMCAAAGGSDWTAAEQFVYVGPEEAAARLPALLDLQRQRLSGLRAQLPAARFRQLTVAQTVQWQRFSEPRDLLVSLAAQAGVTLENPERLPHDVWAAGAWPRLPFLEAATLLLNQFDLQLADGDQPGSLRIEPLNLQASLERAYSFARDAQDRVTTAVLQQFPELRPQWTSGTLRVQATVQQHAWLTQFWQRWRMAAAAPAASPENSLKSRKFTLQVAHATVRQVIDSFRSNGIPIEVADADDPAVQAVLQQELELNLQSVSGAQFFHEVFGRHFQTVTVDDDRVILLLRSAP